MKKTKKRKSNLSKIIIILLVLMLPAVIIYAKFIEPNMLKTTHYTTKTTDINKDFNLVLFSDTHFGSMYSPDKIEEIVQKINAQNPDIVVFGGDFFDNYHKDSKSIDTEYLSSQLSQINATYGKFAVWGNHDTGGGASRVYPQMMNDGGFTVLKNAIHQIPELNVAFNGVDDLLLGIPDFFSNDLSPEQYNILVSHAPDFIDQIDTQNVDFTLGAHSHGGQISLPFVTKLILPRGAEKYVKGPYDVTPESKVYVTGGIGTTQKAYRLFSVPEIVSINFKKTT